MWVVAFMGNQINVKIRQKIRFAYPYFMGFMAILLIVRGLDLNIPFLSPHLEIAAGKVHSCCSKP